LGAKHGGFRRCKLTPLPDRRSPAPARISPRRRYSEKTSYPSLVRMTRFHRPSARSPAATCCWLSQAGDPRARLVIHPEGVAMVRLISEIRDVTARELVLEVLTNNFDRQLLVLHPACSVIIASVQECRPNRRRPPVSPAGAGCVGVLEAGVSSRSKCCPNPRLPSSESSADSAVVGDSNAGDCLVWDRCPNGLSPGSMTGVVCAAGRSGGGSGTREVRRLTADSQPSASLDGARMR